MLRQKLPSVEVLAEYKKMSLSEPKISKSSQERLHSKHFELFSYIASLHIISSAVSGHLKEKIQTFPFKGDVIQRLKDIIYGDEDGVILYEEE